VSGFATSLAGWVLASALNTNQLGFDADRSAASLRDGDTAWRILLLKNLGVRGRWAARATWPRFALCLVLPYAVYHLLLSLWHLPELALADLFFHRQSHRHLWGYSWSLFVWDLHTWALGLALSGHYTRRYAARLETDLDRHR
jgi:hypothetical protein